RCYRDWSSDVCSSDLASLREMYHSQIRVRTNNLVCSAQSRLTCCLLHTLLRSTYMVVRPHSLTGNAAPFIPLCFMASSLSVSWQIGRASCRQRVYCVL